MQPFKQVDLRLTETLLARVEAFQAGLDNQTLTRSESLRRLIEAGLDSQVLTQRLADIEDRLDRMSHVLEQSYQLSFMSLRILQKSDESFKARIDAEMSAARSSLANSLVDRFGK